MHYSNKPSYLHHVFKTTLPPPPGYFQKGPPTSLNVSDLHSLHQVVGLHLICSPIHMLMFLALYIYKYVRNSPVIQIDYDYYDIKRQKRHH
jgi:hypothetical protein